MEKDIRRGAAVNNFCRCGAYPRRPIAVLEATRGNAWRRTEKMAEEYKPWLWKAPEGGVVGKRRVRRVDGYEKASGTAVYVRDIYRPGMLYGKLLLSPYAHAKIKRMNTKEAESLIGVRAVLRYDDPEEIRVKKFTGTEFGTHDMLPDTAHYFGQPVGAVVIADSEAICDRALKLIEIEWEQLPFILDWDEALKLSPAAA
jgi:CO/xanthine dehydrogenase Mo-binding subunit